MNLYQMHQSEFKHINITQQQLYVNKRIYSSKNCSTSTEQHPKCKFFLQASSFPPFHHIGIY